MMRKFHTQFTENFLTGNAGLVHLARFMEKLGLDKMLESHISISRGNSADYDVSTAIEMIALGAVSGIKHLKNLHILREDRVLRTLFKWNKFPHATTFGRIIRLFTPKHCNELSEVEAAARQKVWHKKWLKRVVLDMDSTVRGVYGKQEGAAKGYNPHKKGQKSYHPLLCFIAETRECLHNWFRTGSAYSANGCVDFMRECLVRLPKAILSVIVRGDSAFFDGKLLEFLELENAQYIVKVKMRGLKHLLSGQRWEKVKNKPGIEMTTFEYRCADWAKSRKFVAIREARIVEVKDELLFPGIPKIEYSYFCYCTNIPLTPWGAHKYYGKRASSENWIEWCKNQMASGSILTQDFYANSAVFQICILAYNLLAWMMRLHDKNGFREEPNTIRMWLIHAPARLVARSHQYFLKMPRHYAFKERWIWIEQSILNLEFS